MLADSVGLALLIVLETLEPAERLAFVLHDVFGMPFDEIAPIVDRSPDATRQLASRARRRVRGQVPTADADLRTQRREIDPFEVRTILMSSAVDLKNDPFVQGSGRVDALAAVELAEGETGRFSAYTEDTVPNVLSAMSGAIDSYSNVLGIIEGGQDIGERLDARFKDSRWFAGYVEQGGQASTEIQIENPSSREMTLEVSAVIEKLVARYEIHNSTRPFESDPVHNSDEFDYVPNYYSIQDLGGIPDGADLMVARLSFPFESFMNQTEVYANHLRIASLYAYDCADSDRDGEISYTENSMVNRGGSWGTVQELRRSGGSAAAAGRSAPCRRLSR